MTTLLFLPDDAVDPAEAEYRWMRFGDGGLVARGRGLPDGDDPVVAVAPAEAVTLHWAELPARSPAQAAAAARLLAAEASATPTAELHVAVGEGDGDERPIGVVGAGAMARWLAMLGAAGIDPRALIPAPMLLPRPEAGYVRAEIAGRGVVRGRSSGFADEPVLTELITGDEPPATLDRAALDAALAAAAAAAAPPLDLRQGSFARRRRVAVDWPLVRRLALLALTILAVSLAISVVRLAKYSFAADAAEARADALAATALPRGETLLNPDRQLAERLGRTRGPGLGFTTTAAAAFAAVRATPGTEVTAADWTADGALRLSIAAEREALATDLLRALQRAGLDARASTFSAANGRVTGELTVRPR